MSELKDIVSRVPTQQSSQSDGFGFKASFINEDEDDGILVPAPDQSIKRRGRPPKTTQLVNGGEFVSAREDEDESPTTNPNIPYKRTYQDTNSMLSGTIKQIDGLSAQIQSDMAQIRASKTLKKKYDYVAMLAGTATGLIGNKISAIREMNNVITNSHNFEIKRIKELKLGAEEDDDKKIMDMYNAFLNAPVGNVQMPFGGITPMQINSPTIGMIGVGVDSNVQAYTGDAGYDSYVANMTPEQNAMTMERNPYIKPVVYYNQETQEKWFDVVDLSTGQSIPNVPRPADFLLRDMRVDTRTGTARNASANMEFHLITIGNRALDEY